MPSLLRFAERNVGGWSFLAVRAPFDSVVDGLRAESAFDAYAPEPKVHRHDGRELTLVTDLRRRHVAVLRLADGDWTVLLRSTGFAYADDCRWVRDTAKQLSKRFAWPAIACAGDEIADCVTYSKGRAVKRMGGVSVGDAAALLERRGVQLPSCTIAGDPPELWVAGEDVAMIEEAAVVSLVQEPPARPPTPRLPLHRMIVSSCLDIMKLAEHTPFAVKNSDIGYEATIVEVVFDPLRIDEVNGEFQSRGYQFDGETLKVIAVADDDSILLWPITPVYSLAKSDREPRMAFYDLLDLTMPFEIKNKKSEIDALLSELQRAQGDSA